jgi:hypothetical protein
LDPFKGDLGGLRQRQADAEQAQADAEQAQADAERPQSGIRVRIDASRVRETEKDDFGARMRAALDVAPVRGEIVRDGAGVKDPVGAQVLAEEVDLDGVAPVRGEIVRDGAGVKDPVGAQVLAEEVDLDGVAPVRGRIVRDGPGVKDPVGAQVSAEATSIEPGGRLAGLGIAPVAGQVDDPVALGPDHGQSSSVIDELDDLARSEQIAERLGGPDMLEDQEVLEFDSPSLEMLPDAVDWTTESVLQPDDSAPADLGEGSEIIDDDEPLDFPTN